MIYSYRDLEDSEKWKIFDNSIIFMIRMEDGSERWTKMNKQKSSKNHVIKIPTHESTASYTFKDENTVIVFTSTSNC